MRVWCCCCSASLCFGSFGPARFSRVAPSDSCEADTHNWMPSVVSHAYRGCSGVGVPVATHVCIFLLGFLLVFRYCYSFYYQHDYYFCIGLRLFTVLRQRCSTATPLLAFSLSPYAALVLTYLRREQGRGYSGPSLLFVHPLYQRLSFA